MRMKILVAALAIVGIGGSAYALMPFGDPYEGG